MPLPTVPAAHAPAQSLDGWLLVDVTVIVAVQKTAAVWST